MAETFTPIAERVRRRCHVCLFVLSKFNTRKRNCNHRFCLNCLQNFWEQNKRRKRERERETLASPKYGIWCLGCSDRKYADGANKTDTVKKSPERITVQLDFDHLEDMTHIHTDTETLGMLQY